MHTGSHQHTDQPRAPDSKPFPERSLLVAQSQPIRIVHLYLSSGHNFKGHHGREPGTHGIRDVQEVECVAYRGLLGDRFYEYKKDYKGQITFFAMEVFHRLRTHFDLADCPPSAMRRNVMTEGVDLNPLIGKRFEIQGLLFEGSEECTPCYWMDRAVTPGTEAFLRGQGGLRARVLSNGRLRCGESTLKVYRSTSAGLGSRLRGH